MNKLKQGMIFPNLKSAFVFLGIENEYFGQGKNKNLKLSEFCKWHRINKHSLMIDEVYDERKTLYVEQKHYTLEDLRDNFINVFEKFGRVPTYNEFEENTNISLNTYANKLKLSGCVYDELIEMYLSKEERRRYRDYMNKHRQSLGRSQGVKNFIKHTDEDLRMNFTKIFDHYYELYQAYPTRAIFNKVSKIDESVYRKKYNMRWSELCIYYGYQIPARFKAEKLALEICKNIFRKDYIPQKTFDWLINETNHHLFCDGYFENLNLVIEFDGAGHRKPIKFGSDVDCLDRQKHNDAIKDNLLSSHGITIVRIDSRLEWYTEEGMREIITSELAKKKINLHSLLKVS